eukprot:395040-Rhodomonas_salina.7
MLSIASAVLGAGVGQWRATCGLKVEGTASLRVRKSRTCGARTSMSTAHRIAAAAKDGVGSGGDRVEVVSDDALP